jgi:uncharacterized glyoxalase superfamily protein PhnB
MKRAIPILRIFDEARAMEFYRDFLGFTIEWEHRFGDNFPLYCQVRRDECVLHLSGHSGDATPGSHVRIEMENVRDFCAALRAKDHKYCKPGDPEMMEWGNLEITLSDPFGNRLTFYECPQKKTD